ncbi:MAG TPA: DUF2127 domain-containing protein [Steroidobacteraceae bacterium]|jgi:uncharacterized membrane protein (DUF2068 family)
MPPATEATKSTSGSAPPRKIDGLRIIALFKFMKALLLILTGYGVHKLLDPELFEKIRTWSATLTDRVDQRLVLHALSWVEGLGPDRLHLVLAITIASTAVVLTEGIGLWLRLRWAEWITVVATTCFIPFELWELFTRPSGRRMTVAITLVVNLLIALYLANRLRLAHERERRES